MRVLHVAFLKIYDFSLYFGLQIPVLPVIFLVLALVDLACDEKQRAI